MRNKILGIYTDEHVNLEENLTYLGKSHRINKEIFLEIFYVEGVPKIFDNFVLECI